MTNTKLLAAITALALTIPALLPVAANASPLPFGDHLRAGDVGDVQLVSGRWFGSDDNGRDDDDNGREGGRDGSDNDDNGRDNDGHDSDGHDSDSDSDGHDSDSDGHDSDD